MKPYIKRKKLGGIELKNKLFLLFLLFLTTILNASDIIKIDYSDVKIEKFNISYFLDKEDNESIQSIQNKKFKTISNYYSFGQSPITLWIKLQIQNTTSIKKQLHIHNDFAYFSKEITIFELINNKFHDQNVYNILQESNNKLNGSILIYPLKLNPKDSITLYMKIKPIVTQALNLKIYDEKIIFQHL